MKNIAITTVQTHIINDKIFEFQTLVSSIAPIIARTIALYRQNGMKVKLIKDDLHSIHVSSEYENNTIIQKYLLTGYTKMAILTRENVIIFTGNIFPSDKEAIVKLYLSMFNNSRNKAYGYNATIDSSIKTLLNAVITGNKQDILTEEMLRITTKLYTDMNFHISVDHVTISNITLRRFVAAVVDVIRRYNVHSLNDFIIINSLVKRTVLNTYTQYLYWISIIGYIIDHTNDGYVYFNNVGNVIFLNSEDITLLLETKMKLKKFILDAKLCYSEYDLPTID